MKGATWIKMLASGAVMCIGGPALVIYVSPTEEELVARYNPELRKRSLENRAERMEDYDRFVSKLKEYSKSDKPIWTAWEEDGERKRKEALQAAWEEAAAAKAAVQAKKDEIKGSIR